MSMEDHHPSSSVSSSVDIEIHRVFAHNCDQEFQLINSFIKEYPLISFDTEFPGMVYLPRNSFHKPKMFDDQTEDERFEFLKLNVADTAIIQLGLTISKDNGELPLHLNHHIIWEFNFKEFDITKHTSDSKSIELLKRSGIDFDRNKREGIRRGDFACFWRRMMKSCLEANVNVTIVVFSGLYDFGYLLQILEEDCPNNFDEFKRAVLSNCNYACLFDVKKICRLVDDVHKSDGLHKLASHYNVHPKGPHHNSGWDSHLTLQLFFALRRIHADKVKSCEGIIHGLKHF